MVPDCLTSSTASLTGQSPPQPGTVTVSPSRSTTTPSALRHAAIAAVSSAIERSGEA